MKAEEILNPIDLTVTCWNKQVFKEEFNFDRIVSNGFDRPLEITLPCFSSKKMSLLLPNAVYTFVLVMLFSKIVDIVSSENKPVHISLEINNYLVLNLLEIDYLLEGYFLYLIPELE